MLYYNVRVHLENDYFEGSYCFAEALKKLYNQGKGYIVVCDSDNDMEELFYISYDLFEKFNLKAFYRYKISTETKKEILNHIRLLSYYRTIEI